MAESGNMSSSYNE